MTQRFVKTQREMEGRFEDVWALVDEEDDLETWPEDADLAIVGKPAPRQDGPLRASGAARYTVDVALPGMLHARVLRAPTARCRVTALDLDAARATTGVRAVLGPDGPFTMGGASVLTAEPSWAGEPIAAVAADTIEAAAAGVAALAPDYEELPPLDAERGLDEQRFTEEPPETVRGDPDGALASAEVTVELTCETPAHVQTPLEPHAAVARWDGDELTAWVSTQGVFDARRELARRFDLQPEQVRVIAEYIGGGFGGKQGAGTEALLAAELARAARRPVRLALGRHEDQVVGGRRAATRQTVTLGARSDGTLTAIELAAVVDMGAAGGYVFPVSEPALSLYACPNVRTMTFPVRTSLRAQNAFRAPGVVEGVTVLEQAIDELAAKLELDPLELRRLNHVDRDQASGLPYSSKRLLACYDRAAELAGWGSRDALARGAAGRAPARDGLRDADLVGRRRAARARDRADRRRRPRARHDRDPGHRHRHAHDGADRRRRGARPPARPGRRAWRRHRPEPLRARLRRLDDDACGDARRPQRGGQGAKDPARRSPPTSSRSPPRISTLRDGRLRSRRRRARRRRHGGDGEARQRDDRRLGNAWAEPRRLPGQHVRLPDRPASRSIRGRASSGWNVSSRCTTSAGSSTR